MTFCQRNPRGIRLRFQAIILSNLLFLSFVIENIIRLYYDGCECDSLLPYIVIIYCQVSIMEYIEYYVFVSTTLSFLERERVVVLHCLLIVPKRLLFFSKIDWDLCTSTRYECVIPIIIVILCLRILISSFRKQAQTIDFHLPICKNSF